MMTTLWNLWTSTEIKVGVLFSFLWLVLEHIVGGFDEQITALVILTSLDILTGFIGAFKTHSFMSSIATRGLFKKAAMILVVGLGVLHGQNDVHWWIRNHRSTEHRGEY